MAAPNILCNTKGMDRSAWLACRAHGPDGSIPIALGGSDVAAIFGLSPWKTPLELWMEKKGLLVPDDSANAEQKEMGHLLEPIVAYWYGRRTGNTVLEDTNLYQHTDHPWALANLDYRAEKHGTAGGLECKSTTYHKAADWADGAVPIYYEYQCRFYMAVMDLPWWDIACLWGNNPGTDMAIRTLEREMTTEEMILDKGAAFVQSIHDNTPPTMEDVEPRLALKALARIYGNSIAGLPTIEFSPKYEWTIRRLAALQAEIAEIEQEKKRKEKEADAHAARIAQVMQEHEHGILELASEKFRIDFVTRARQLPDVEKLKSIYGPGYKDVTKTSCSRKIRVVREVI